MFPRKPIFADEGATLRALQKNKIAENMFRHDFRVKGRVYLMKISEFE
jgi:hypothetical protein